MFKCILNAILPGHVKRLLFCGSVYAHIAIAHQVTPNSDRLKGLNKRLRIASRDDSIMPTCSWSKQVWKELPPPPYTDDKLRQYSDVILKSVPEYLLYGKEGVMRKDLTKIVRYILQDTDFKAVKTEGESLDKSDAALI